METFADDATVLSINENPRIASKTVQDDLNLRFECYQILRTKVNQTKSALIIFTTRLKTSPPVTTYIYPETQKLNSFVFTWTSDALGIQIYKQNAKN